jgi:prephenate dehydrogenase
VGLTPVLNPAYIHNEGYGIAVAREDLFQDGLFGIITPPQSNAQAVKLATDLIQLLGANPLFIDPYESDGLMTTTHVVPQFLSIALLDSTLNKPGWNEARKIAGRAYAEASGPAAHLDDAEALGAAANHNRENVIRKLDDLILVLQEIRQEIAQDDAEGLLKRLKEAKAGVNQWWLERGRGNWLAEELPQGDDASAHSSILGNLFGFDPKRRKKRN